MSRVTKFLLSFAVFVAVCYVGLMWFVNSEVGKGLDHAVASTPGLALSYDNLSVSLINHSVTLEGVESTLPSGQRFTASEVRITKFDQKNRLPQFAAAEAYGVNLPVTRENFGTWYGPFRAMGIDAVIADVAFEYSYAPETRTVTLRELTIESAELGDFSLSGSVDQVNLNELRPEQLIGLRILDVDLTFTDRSLLARAIKPVAKTLGKSEEEYRAGMGGEFAILADTAERNSYAVAAEALRGVREFVERGSTITLSARPEEPVPWLYFFMGRDLFDNITLLNISVATESDSN